MMSGFQRWGVMRALLIAVIVPMSFVAPVAANTIGVWEAGNFGGLITLEIIVDGVIPPLMMDWVEFMLTVPDCPGLTLVDVSYGSNLHLGSLETGVSVAFVGCKSVPHVVATLTFQSTGVGDCCYIELEPHPQSATGQIEGGDCDGNVINIFSVRTAIAPAGSGFECGRPTVPSNPSPPDGATDQPLNVTLNWETEAPLGTEICPFFNWLYLGTDPEPPLIDEFGFYPPHEVGPLQAGTTYYWKIRAYNCAAELGATGPVWQFTTADPVAVEISTWGKIKSLYR
jgi:hypothetical protein